MAGQKLSPRQKMINLMYLVFIAMMALQMSREALTAFAMMSDKFEESSKNAQANNETLLEQLAMKAEEEELRFSPLNEKAQQINVLANDFTTYLETLKTSITDFYKRDENGNLPYEQMEKNPVADYEWFVKDKYSEKGEEIEATIDNFRNSFKEIIGDEEQSYRFLRDKLDELFNTDKVTDSEGIERDYLDYHYKGLPSVSAMAKLSSMQNDVRQVEQEAYNLFLGNTYKQSASLTNYRAMVFTDKSVYFEGEPISGSVVLARYDNKTVPTEVVVNGTPIDLGNPNSFSNGQVQISTRAGRVGEHSFTGQFTFLEDGQPVPVEIKSSNYVVVPRPNSATIAADRMNVVYIGVENPISASFAGVPSNQVSVTASKGELSRVADGRYILKPTEAGAIVVTATGTLSDGSTVSDQQEFRVKMVPRPMGTIRGSNEATGPIDNLKVSTVGARFEDFEFEVDINVTEFTVIFPRGLGSETIKGSNRLSAQAQRKVDQLRSGDVVHISGIKTSLRGVNIPSRDATNATYTIQ